MSVKLDDVVAAMGEIAPLELAEEWDNVGLLVEPTKRRRVKRVLLTIDLTEGVMEEAIGMGAEVVVAYHPLIFEGIKRVTGGDWKGRVVGRALEKGVAVYSPHTALDAVEGGVNDWLADMFKDCEPTRYSLKPHRRQSAGQRYKLVVYVPETHVDTLRDILGGSGAGWIGNYGDCSFNVEGEGTFRSGKGAKPVVGKSGRLERVREVRLEMVCCSDEGALQEIENTIREFHPYEEPAWDLYKLEPKAMRYVGQGRDVCLHEPIPLKGVVERVKKHLKLKHVRVAAAERHKSGSEKIRMVGLCAGAGGSLLAGQKRFDLLLTGEMRHHDVLDANARGVSVILTDHTNSERGYLRVLKKRLGGMLGKGVEVVASKVDGEPLRVV